MTLKVLSPGLNTLLVDSGRPRTRSLGVPVGGAADRFSLAIGNALVGNPPDAVALEINLAGPVLQAEVPVACALCGAPFLAKTDHRVLRTGYSFNLNAGEVLRIGGSERGARAYLCVQGAFTTPCFLDSHSSLSPIRPDMDLVCPEGRLPERGIEEAWEWNRQPLVLRILDGAQSDWFHFDELTSQNFTVQTASNRMGLRVRGVPLTHRGQEIASEPVCPGTVQVLRDGQCIVLGADSQTIGGYPKIAQVISADLDKAGQLRADDSFRFERVSLEDAERLYQDKQRELKSWLLRLQIARTLV